MFGLVCPTCGELVRLRQGPERRPHFAHYSNRAKPDCENYYPPTIIAQPPGHRPPTHNSALVPRRDSLRCGLFLTHRPDLNVFELSLRIPSLASVGHLNGRLEIQHGLGHKSYTAGQLTKSYSVRIVPNVPLVECSGTADLLPLSDHLSAQASSFAPGLNLFSSTDSGGRFMFVGEPLEWGGRYWIVTDTEVVPPDEVTSLLEWNHCGPLGGWHIYAVELPAKFLASRPETESLLSEFFDRVMRPARPRAYIVQPSPHHLAEDGAYIYPQPPECLYVRRTSNQAVSVEGSPELLAGIAVTELSDDLVQIEGLRDRHQDVAILINGIEQALVRIEECGLTQPAGLRAYTGELTWDLIADAPLPPQELFSREVKMECGSPRLAAHIAKLNDNWNLDGSVVALPHNTAKALNAGGFGGIRSRIPSLLGDQDFDQDTASEQRRQRSIKGAWIEGLVGSKYGQHAAYLVREFLANPSRINLQKLGPIVTSPLMAYVRAALNNQRP